MSSQRHREKMATLRHLTVMIMIVGGIYFAHEDEMFDAYFLWGLAILTLLAEVAAQREEKREDERTAKEGEQDAGRDPQGQ